MLAFGSSGITFETCMSIFRVLGHVLLTQWAEDVFLCSVSVEMEMVCTGIVHIILGEWGS